MTSVPPVSPDTLLPDVYLVGAPKAGTTTVASWLGSHPAVHVSEPKEPFHWASDYPRMREHYGFTDREAYVSLFRGAGQQATTHRVDASTTYLYSRNAVPAILENVAEPRFLACVRNPVDQVVSYHRTQVVALNEPEDDFARAWRRSDAERDSIRALDSKLLDYRTVARQGAALERLQELAGPERVHVVVFDDIVARPQQVWSDLVSFLALEPCQLPDSSRSNPSNKTYRWKTARRLSHRPPAVIAPGVQRLRQWARTTDMPLVGRAKELLWKSADRPSIDDDLRRELEAELSDDVRRLQRLLDRDLRGWLTTPARPVASPRPGSSPEPRG